MIQALMPPGAISGPVHPSSLFSQGATHSANCISSPPRVHPHARLSPPSPHLSGWCFLAIWRYALRTASGEGGHSPNSSLSLSSPSVVSACSSEIVVGSRDSSSFHSESSDWRTRRWSWTGQDAKRVWSHRLRRWYRWHQISPCAAEVRHGVGQRASQMRSRSTSHQQCRLSSAVWRLRQCCSVSPRGLGMPPEAWGRSRIWQRASRGAAAGRCPGAGRPATHRQQRVSFKAGVPSTSLRGTSSGSLTSTSCPTTLESPGAGACSCACCLSTRAPACRALRRTHPQRPPDRPSRARTPATARKASPRAFGATRGVYGRPEQHERRDA